MRIDRISTSSPRPDSQTWVDASIPRKPLLDWRELVINGLHYSGTLHLARRLSKSHEIPPGGGWLWPRFRRVQNPKFVILCYHGIGESGNPLIAAPTREGFEAQMRFLRRNYRIVSLEDVCRDLSGSSNVEPGVAITFDDGYRSAYTIAFPILQKYRLPATIYLTAESVETGQVAWYDRVFLAISVAPAGEFQLDLESPWVFHLNSSEDRLRTALQIVDRLRTLPNSTRREYCALLERKIGLAHHAVSDLILTWDQIHTMQHAGIAFGSHTLTHPVVSQLAPAELERELADSKLLLEERLGVRVTDFAFPFGKASDCGSAALNMLSRCGYRSAVTTVQGVNTPHVNRFELRRLQVGCDVSLARLAFDLNQAFLRVEDLPALNPSPVDSVVEQLERSPRTVECSAGEPDA